VRASTEELPEWIERESRERGRVVTNGERHPAGAPQNRTLTTLAVNEIRRRILAGEIAAGEKVHTGSIAKDLGISPVPVREALQALQGEGLIRIVGHRGAIAAPTSAKELAELYQLRELLEPAAVNAVDLSLIQDRLHSLTEALERVDFALNHGDRDAFRVAHRDFHFGIYACTGNDWWVRIIRGLYDNCERYRTTATWSRDPREAADEHRFMLVALREARADDAAQLTLAHLEVTKQLALSSINHTEERTSSSRTTGGSR
jgi:DNA-binding GntR family transcriptional regulator